MRPVASLHRLRELCRDQRLIWMVRRGSSFFGMHDLFDESCILCLDDSAELDGVAGARFFTYEGKTGVRGNWQMGTNSLFDELWRSCQTEVEGHQWRVVSAHTNPELDRWAAETSSTVHVPPADLLARLNHKKTLFEILDRLQLPRVPGEWSTMGAQRLAHWEQKYGTPFVVQLPVGTGGFGTSFVSGEEDWNKTAERFMNADVWIAPYLGDLSLNINGIAIPDGSVVGYPSVQLTGFAFLNHGSGMYCGNDFGAVATLPRELLEDVRRQTAGVGDCIAEMGFVGLFGLDFVVGAQDGVARAVDLNPRWQGSTPLFGQAQRRQGLACLPAAALVLQGGLVPFSVVSSAAEEYFAPVEGAQVRIRWPEPGLTPIAQSPRTGVYSLSGDWRREGFLLEHLQPGEVLVTGDPPRAGTPVEEGCQWFRIYSVNSVLDPVGQPERWIRELTARLAGDHANPDTGRR